MAFKNIWVLITPFYFCMLPVYVHSHNQGGYTDDPLPITPEYSMVYGCMAYEVCCAYPVDYSFSNNRWHEVRFDNYICQTHRCPDGESTKPRGNCQNLKRVVMEESFFQRLLLRYKNFRRYRDEF
ncbi:hypothetical protein ACH42_13730 [Endozoicomonas sp. (ex Bugula neritina AB1)]|nr:hypothetical protein ACH42_13730 [Endozoicomonas sp. (ex Bugula neritina AB1)]